MSGGRAALSVDASPDVATDGDAGCPGLCDDFERTTPLGPLWTGVGCGQGSLTVDHQLRVIHPASSSSGFVSCALEGVAGPASSRARVEFDYRAETSFSGSDYQAIGSVDFAPPSNAAGVTDVVYEIMLDANDALHVGTVAVTQGVYDFAVVAETSVPSVRFGSMCHLIFDVDFAHGTGAVSSTCDGLTTTTIPKAPSSTRSPV